MPRHAPRTIWKPNQVFHTTIVNSSAPPVAFFQALRSVDADATQGLQLKHVTTILSLGLTNATSLDNTRVTSGHMGFFKWPIDAAAPTAATMDLNNRGSIWNRRTYVIQGDTVLRITLRSKTMRLKLGDEIWFYILKSKESDVADTETIQGVSSWFETEA